jgi:hypothetical protein
MAEPRRSSAPRSTGGRSDRSPALWLLLIPLLTLVYPPLYNRLDPHLFGIPLFYWYQLAMIGVGVICTLLVYRLTQARSGQARATRNGAGR